MRKIVLALLAAVVFSGVAFAQSGYYIAASAGYPGAAIHFGIEDVGVTNLDARINLGYSYVGTSALSFGLDALYQLDVDMSEVPVDVYVGGGVGATFGGSFLIKALVGGSYGLAEVGVENMSVFVEVGPTFSVGGSFGADARLGVAYAF